MKKRGSKLSPSYSNRCKSIGQKGSLLKGSKLSPSYAKLQASVVFHTRSVSSVSCEDPKVPVIRAIWVVESLN